jgi:hypothetical protein
VLPCLQEIYWRIPGNITPQDLRKSVEVINRALDGTLIAQENSKYQYIRSYTIFT